ncbi:MAG TPA: hypothetical protein VG891_07900 [Rhizomicrobium sp.]|nr:hypothetical protein [Rhizomicrobium sp.]
MVVGLRVSGLEVDWRDTRRIVLADDIDSARYHGSPVAVLILDQRLELFLRLEFQSG